MNPGYLSLILICVTFILLASGWKDILLKGSRHGFILAFFAFWFLGSFLTIHYGNLTLNPSFVVIPITSMLIIFKVKGFLGKLHLMTIGVLLGFIFYLLKELAVDPMLTIEAPMIDTAIFFGLFAFLLNRNPIYQLAILFLGLTICEIYSEYAHRSTIPIVIGDSTFQDIVWLSLVVSRSAGIFVQYGTQLVAQTASKLGFSKKGEEE